MVSEFESLGQIVVCNAEILWNSETLWVIVLYNIKLHKIILSISGFGKARLNMVGPPTKPKYKLKIDSEQVLWRKGEKHSEQRGWKEFEIGIVVSYIIAYLLHNGPAS